MAWEQASPDGGPLTPASWRRVGDSARESALEARIASGDQLRQRRSDLLQELSAVETELANLKKSIRAAAKRVPRSMLPDLLDLPRSLAWAAGLMRSPEQAGEPPTRRLRDTEAYALLTSEQKAAIERRGRIRMQLASTDAQFGELVEAAREKARRVIERRLEGWQRVEQALTTAAQAEARLERIDVARTRIHEAVAAAKRAEEEILALLSWRWRSSTEFTISNDRADDAVQAAGRFVRAAATSLEAAGATGYDFDRPLPRIQSASRGLIRRRQARAALAAVRQVRLRLESHGALEEPARLRREELAAAQDTVVELMRRPY